MPKPAVPLEHKAIWATLLAAVIGPAISALNGLNADSSILAPLPATWQAIILAMAPMVAIGLGVYLAPHTDRGPLAASRSSYAEPVEAYSVTTYGEPTVWPTPSETAPVGEH